VHKMRVVVAVLSLFFACGAGANASGLINVSISPDAGRSGSMVTIAAVGFRDTALNPRVTTTYTARVFVDYQIVADGLPVGHVLSGWYQGTIGVGATTDAAAAVVKVSGRPGEHHIGIEVDAHDNTGTRYVDGGEKIFTIIPSVNGAANAVFNAAPTPNPTTPLSNSLGPALTLRITDIGPLPVRAGVTMHATVDLDIETSGTVHISGIVINADKSETPLYFASGTPFGGTVLERTETVSRPISMSITTEAFALRGGTSTIRFTARTEDATVTAQRVFHLAGVTDPDGNIRPHKVLPSPPP